MDEPLARKDPEDSTFFFLSFSVPIREHIDIYSSLRLLFFKNSFAYKLGEFVTNIFLIKGIRFISSSFSTTISFLIIFSSI